MTIILESEASPETGVRFELDVNVSALVQVSALQARRLVNRYLMEHVGSALYGTTPENLIVVRDQVYWQVPIFLSRGPEGTVGPVAVVRIHIESGELSLTENFLEEVKRNAQRSAAGTSPNPVF